MDLPAVLARKPELCLIDELAHTNAPGVEHEKRYEDVRDVLEAGIDVFSTVNVQHLETLNDQITQLTGARMRETIPDEVLSMADEVVLIDLTPEALIARLRAGKVYPARASAGGAEQLLQDREPRRPARDGAAAGGRGRRGQAARARAGPGRCAATRRVCRRSPQAGPQAIAERLLALATLAPHSERVVRRAWRSAQRLDAELDVLVVRPPGRAPSAEDRERLEALRRLVSMLGRAPARRGGRGRGRGRDLRRALARHHVRADGHAHASAAACAGSASRRLLMRLLRGLPGVDIRIVADPTLRGAARERRAGASRRGARRAGSATQASRAYSCGRAGPGLGVGASGSGRLP